MLARLPPEVITTVAEQVDTIDDLKSLSLSSRNVNLLVAPILWRCLGIPLAPQMIDGSAPFHYVTHLQLRLNAPCIRGKLCSHQLEQQDNDYPNDIPSHRELSFQQIEQKANALLHQLHGAQLRSFSWDLGTCVPRSVLGRGGIISINQPLLESLELNTDHACSVAHARRCKMDLSALCRLKKISWKSPHAVNIPELSAAIRRNRARLQTLEIDLISRKRMGMALADLLSNYAQINGTPKPRPFFSALRVLSLSQVPLHQARTDNLDLEHLDQLNLRRCPGWAGWLERIMSSGLKIALRILELQASNEELQVPGGEVVVSFLGSFQGLEELYLSIPYVEPIKLWRPVTGHRLTLKNLVQHPRHPDRYGLWEDHVWGERNFLRLFEGGGMGSNTRNKDAFSNLLGQLNLECIGLPCFESFRVGADWELILTPFKLKTSLKCLHIRQGWPVNLNYASIDSHLAMLPLELDCSSWFGDEKAASKLASLGIQDRRIAPEYHFDWLGMRGMDDPQIVRLQLQSLARWAFGSAGLSSLEAIAIGDFGYGAGLSDIILCRDSSGPDNFRTADKGSRKWQHYYGKYRRALEACPYQNPVLSSPPSDDPLAGLVGLPAARIDI